MTALRTKYTTPGGSTEKGATQRPDPPLQPGEADAKPQTPSPSKADGGESAVAGEPAARPGADDGMGEEGADVTQPAAEKGAEKVDPAAEGADATPKDGKAMLDGKKVSPWKLVEHYKGHMTKLQSEIASLRANPGEHPEYKSITEKLSTLEKQNAELQDEIRYVNYQKHPEFVEKYQKPYEEAWGKAVTGLKGLQLQFTHPESGEVTGRDITPQDIAAFAGADPATARQQIRQLFPDPADATEVRAYVDRIRELAGSQQKALDDQRKVAGDRDKTRTEEQQRVSKALTEEIGKTWAEVNAEVTAKYEFLRPVEGQEERNTVLEKATAFVDEALKETASNPKLTKEARAAIIKKHAALRNRAIGFSVLKFEDKSLHGKVTELQKQLAAYQKSEPAPGGGGRNGTAVAIPGDPMAAAVNRLRTKYV